MIRGWIALVAALAFGAIGVRASRADEARAAAPGPRRGAAPGDENGPGKFIARRRDDGFPAFYAGAGGRLWYYLNLYYWVPEGTDTTDLWIRSELVEEVKDLVHWPDDRRIPAPAPKKTLEYWRVGPLHRTQIVDNHRDYWLESSDVRSGRIVVSMTLALGRLDEKTSKGEWVRATKDFRLAWNDYDAGISDRRSMFRFTPAPHEPVDTWRYEIPWAATTGKFLRSDWQKLQAPELVLVSSDSPAAPDPVVTTAR